MVALTIGMATYNDFDGVYFTIQALQLYQDLADTELLVIDNFGCDDTRNLVESWVKGRYIRARDVTGTAAPRDRVFREAAGDAVLCCDSHVLFAPGVIARLKAYYRDHPACADLLQGPLVYDDAKSISTHFDPVWRAHMWGPWGTDPRGVDPEGEPFEIPMQGLGAFSCRKSVWPGFNPAFRGFGGEEGYIHEKFRQQGGRTLCLPWLRWMHRFGRPRGVPYPLTIEDKLRNYVIGHMELGLDILPALEHFAESISNERVLKVAADAVHDISGVAIEPFSGITIAPPEPLATAPPSDLPLISCVCMTYNRAPTHLHLLEETIESFLRQTYPNKELIILNDTPGQELVCDAPGVRIVNAPERFKTLGAKARASFDLARGPLIAPWDDDDINLPWRLSLSYEQLGDADYFNAGRYWYFNPREYHSDQSSGYAFNGSLFRATALNGVEGLLEINSGYDALIDGAFLKSSLKVAGPKRDGTPLPLDRWYYIYRWGVSPGHISGGDHTAGYDTLGMRPVTTGAFELHPHWDRDYLAETRAALPR